MVCSCPLDARALGPPAMYKSATTCTLPGTSCWELQSDLQMAATSAGLEGAQERPNWEQRPAAASQAWGHLEVWGKQRPDAACLRDIKKVRSMRQEWPFVWKSYWKQLGLVLSLFLFI